MTNDEGISLIALIVTIIVVIILSLVVIRIGTNEIDSTIESKVSAEKSELETAIIKRFADYSINSLSSPLIGSSITDNDISQFPNASVANIDFMRKVSPSNIQALGIKNTTGHTYIVDYLDAKVFGPVIDVEPDD